MSRFFATEQRSNTVGANDAASPSSGRAKLVQIGTSRTYKPNSRPVDSLRVAGRRKILVRKTASSARCRHAEQHLHRRRLRGWSVATGPRAHVIAKGPRRRPTVGCQPGQRWRGMRRPYSHSVGVCVTQITFGGRPAAGGVREWIDPAPASSDLMLGAQPTA